MVANSARLIVCLSCCDLMSMRVVVRVMGLTIYAPGVGLPVFCDPSVYIKSLGFHAARKCRMGYRLWLGVVGIFLGRDVCMIGCSRFVAGLL